MRPTSYGKAVRPEAEHLNTFDVVGFAWDRLLENADAGEIVRQFQLASASDSALRRSMTLGLERVDTNRFEQMPAGQV
jgi:hypothetical protein